MYWDWYMLNCQFLYQKKIMQLYWRSKRRFFHWTVIYHHLAIASISPVLISMKFSVVIFDQSLKHWILTFTGQIARIILRLSWSSSYWSYWLIVGLWHLQIINIKKINFKKKMYEEAKMKTTIITWPYNQD